MLTPEENQKIIDAYDFLPKAASARDCTGLIPFLPVSHSELESYQNLYQYHPTFSQVLSAANPKNEKTDAK